MSIYLAHSASIKLTHPRLATCEHCNTEYIYEMRRTARGHAESGLVIGRRSAKAAAVERAAEQAEHILREGCSPVPCPNCHMYQRHMYRESGRRKYEDMKLLTIFFLISSVVTCFIFIMVVGMRTAGPLRPGDAEEFSRIERGVLTAVGVVAGLMMASHAAHDYLVRHHDPNRSSKTKRAAAAKSKAMTPEEFSRVHSARVAAAYREFASTRRPIRGRRPSPDNGLFVFDTWVRRSELVVGSHLTVNLLDGQTVFIQIDSQLADGHLWGFTNPQGGEEPFAARIRILRGPESTPS